MLMGHTYGIDPQAPLFEAGREEMDIELFEKALPALNEVRGRKARELRLPVVDWAFCEEGELLGEVGAARLFLEAHVVGQGDQDS